MAGTHGGCMAEATLPCYPLRSISGSTWPHLDTSSLSHHSTLARSLSLRLSTLTPLASCSDSVNSSCDFHSPFHGDAMSSVCQGAARCTDSISRASCDLFSPPWCRRLQDANSRSKPLHLVHLCVWCRLTTNPAAVFMDALCPRNTQLFSGHAALDLSPNHSYHTRLTLAFLVLFHAAQTLSLPLF